MAGLLEFAARFGTEAQCIERLAELRWPGGFVCSSCGGRAAWRLKARPRRGFLEADETFIGGRGDPTSRGRSTANPDKSLVVAAVEKVPAPKNKKGRHGHAVRRQHGFFAGNARIAVLPSATSAELGAFLKENVAAQSHLLTDGFASYRGRDAALGEHLKHTPVVQDEGVNAGEFFPIIHTLFSNITAWLVGTHHGVRAKHLPRSLPECSA